MKINIQPHSMQPVPLPKRQSQAAPPTTKTNFKNILAEQLLDTNEGLKLSKHAEKRLNDREITIASEKWQHIERQVMEAEAKGVTDSLVITDEAALIVSVKNKTVITALDRHEASTHIFTNINGTIVIDT